MPISTNPTKAPRIFPRHRSADSERPHERVRFVLQIADNAHKLIDPLCLDLHPRFLVVPLRCFGVRTEICLIVVLDNVCGSEPVHFG